MWSSLGPAWGENTKISTSLHLNCCTRSNIIIFRQFPDPEVVQPGSSLGRKHQNLNLSTVKLLYSLEYNNIQTIPRPGSGPAWVQPGEKTPKSQPRYI